MIYHNGIRIVVDNKTDENYMKWDKKLKVYKCTQNTIDKIKKMVPDRKD